MQFTKYGAIVALITSLIGCGHGYEGEFRTEAGSSNELLNAFSSAAGSQTIVIGSDYIESEGQRTEFDEIFVRESGNQSFLVFKDNKSEEAWKIIDKDTLIQDHGYIKIKLARVK